MELNTNTLIQSVVVAVVAGMAVFWLTSAKQGCLANEVPSGSKKNVPHGRDSIVLGARQVAGGMPSDVCCLCCRTERHVPSPFNGEIPLASDYLCCAPGHAPTTSRWNVGISLQLSKPCDARQGAWDQQISTASYGAPGPNTTPELIPVVKTVQCSPQIPITVCCIETV